VLRAEDGFAVGRLTLATVAHGRSEAPLVAAGDEVDLARARYWQLLGLLLRAAPDDQTLALVGGLEGDTSPLGSALSKVATAARAADSGVLEREYHHLFIGVGRGELLPYGSFYLTGFLHEKPLARLRADLARLGVARAPAQADPEDHIASLAEVMAGLIAGDFRADTGTQENFFSRHLAPWAASFFADLEGAEAASFYRPVGTIGRLLVDIEATAYTLAA
jgi:TorA maturation chaperone TorD